MIAMPRPGKLETATLILFLALGSSVLPAAERPDFNGTWDIDSG